MDADLLTGLSKGLPKTVEECHVVIKDLCKMVQGLCTQLESLRRSLEHLKAENQQLKERLNLNSKNSSRPPSSDNQTSKRGKRKKKGSGKPSGGQPGHVGHYRALEDETAVDVIVPCALTSQCECCGQAAVEPSGAYSRHQVYELPPLKLRLTEYQLAKGRCQHCGQRQQARLPAGVTWGMTGPRLTSLMTLLVSEYHLSRREVQRFLKDYFNFKLSLGSVFNKQRLVNAALEEPVDALLAVVKTNHCNMDETSHARDGQRHWLWAMASGEAAYFEIVASRGKKVVKRLLEGFQHIVTSDRYAAYNVLDSSRRQLCWAHLKRDFTRFSQRKDPVIARLGKELLRLESQLFELWYAFKAKQITRDTLYDEAKRLKQAVGETLEKGRYTAPELRMARFCHNLLEHFYALWTFLAVEGVEPTNNHAERCLRPWVIWRKKYFQTRSEYGSQFVARTASLKMTCQFQAKKTFVYLSQALTHYFSGRPAPPIISPA